MFQTWVVFCRQRVASLTLVMSSLLCAFNLMGTKHLYKHSWRACEMNFPCSPLLLLRSNWAHGKVGTAKLESALPPPLWGKQIYPEDRIRPSFYLDDRPSVPLYCTTIFLHSTLSVSCLFLNIILQLILQVICGSVNRWVLVLNHWRCSYFFFTLFVRNFCYRRGWCFCSIDARTFVTFDLHLFGVNVLS